MDTRIRRGQAFIELSIGLFVLALVLSALFAFASVIIHSLDSQRSLRCQAGGEALHSSGLSGSFSSAEASDTVEIDPLPATYFFGSQQLGVSDEVHIPHMGILR